MAAPTPPPEVEVRPEAASGGTRRLNGPRLAVLFLLGVLLFNYPLLAVFDRATTVLGIPVLYVYIFLAWALLIALLVLVVERRT